MDDVKGHSVYETLLWDELEAKLTRAPWIPDGPAGTAEADEASTSDDVYTGNQVRVYSRSFLVQSRITLA